MKFLDKPVRTTPLLAVCSIILGLGLIVNSANDYFVRSNHQAAIMQLAKEVSHKQPVIDKATIESLTAQVDSLQSQVNELNINAIQLNQDAAKARNEAEKVKRTNVRPEYETDAAGRRVRNSDTYEQAMKNCDAEANLVNFMTYGEPHPSCR